MKVALIVGLTIALATHPLETQARRPKGGTEGKREKPAPQWAPTPTAEPMLETTISARSKPRHGRGRSKSGRQLTPPSPPASPPLSPAPAPAPVPVEPAAAAEPVPPLTGASNETSRDQDILGGSTVVPQSSDEVAPENPLAIGGQLYLRAQSSTGTYKNPDRWPLSAPSLIDLYFDARPNQRLRAFLLERVSYDPTAPPAASSSAPPTMPSTGFTSFSTSRGPSASLDQLWLSFDIKRRIFITGGKQHVRWGTGKIWTPTDYLHPVRRNPVGGLDLRPGVTMLAIKVPVEQLAWNLYGFAVLEDPNSSVTTARQVAGAARAEIVLLSAELGLDVFVKPDQKPRYGLDLSVGVGDVDLYADAAIRDAGDFYVVTSPTSAPIRLLGTSVQVVTGLSWSLKYGDNDVFTMGSEYFYNAPGYRDGTLYPNLIAQAVANPTLPLVNFFYLGRHYASVFMLLPGPYSWNNTTFGLTGIGNLSDRSFLARADYSLTLLTQLTFQLFATGHFGHNGGELRFSLAGSTPPALDFGLALKMKF